MARIRAIVLGLAPHIPLPCHMNLEGLSLCRLRHYYGFARRVSTSAAIRSAHTPGQIKANSVHGESPFLALFPRLVDEVSATFHGPGTEDVAKKLGEVCEYNVPHGKLNRGLLVVDSFSAFANGRTAVDESVREKALVLGWCVEWLQASLLVLDDVMDGSPLRRGQSSWHAKPEVGIAAVNDGLFLENCVFLLLERHFSHLPCYISLVSLFRSIMMKTIFGQSLDMSSVGRPSDSNPKSDSRMCRFTRARYEAICVNKTALYTFVLPVLAGLRLAGVSNVELESRLTTLLLRLGVFFQSQDDFLDFVDDPLITGKVGTDIQEGKCTWLVVEALARADDESKELLRLKYGSADPADVANVKKIYRDLDLPAVFEDYEERMRLALKNEIADLESLQIPTTFLFDVLDKLQKRRK